MGILYLTEQSAVLRKHGGRFAVELNGETIREIPAIKLERVLIFGGIQLTTQSINALLDAGIDAAFLTMYGKLHGRLTPVESKNVYLRLKQFQAYGDETFRSCFARELVRAKLSNGRRLLQKLAWQRDCDMGPHLDVMEQCIRQAQTEERRESLRGIEGRGTAAYFKGFSKLVQGFEFEGRNRRPPKDPVNSLLSFGYTLLTNEAFAAAAAAGLDPYFGFYHEVQYGRPALAFDLCEEFRHLVVDGLVLNLINHRRLKQDDFEPNLDSGGLVLKHEARKRFLAAYEDKLREKRKADGDADSYRTAIHNQVDVLRKTLNGGAPYKGFAYS